MTQDSNKCYCKNETGFFITKKQASSIIALLIAFFIVTSVISYLWGQRHATQEFTGKMVDDFFADKINYSYCSLYGCNGNQNSAENENDEESDIDDNSQDNNSNLTRQEQLNIVESPQDVDLNKVYYAELVGYSTLKAAQSFVKKCNLKGYKTFINEKKSRTSKGKIIHWYQVITEKFNDKSKLINLIEDITSCEYLNNPKIVTINL